MDAAIDRFLAEDIGKGDRTTNAIVRGERAVARLYPREACVLAGNKEAAFVFERLGARAQRLIDDGRQVASNANVLRVEGDAGAILTGERLALNFLMRLSGIATTTRFVVQQCRIANPKIEVAATRKTTPGFRAFEKKAVVLGGGHKHRSRLDEAILVKDNHAVVAGGVGEAVRRARSVHPESQIEAEAKTRQEAFDALKAGAQSILLDNMKSDEVGAIAVELRAANPNVFIEASGGITPENARAYARHVDRVSLGALTHSARAIDFSLDFEVTTADAR
ncbi:MAG TPA: carboxylating nicotinate-nucleotide diphosphorylase [Burkholderiales bacterium]|nr:carboxylating nicotinate-nucleotide diphosphorylase [Burkholderiales bacterium]